MHSLSNFKLYTLYTNLLIDLRLLKCWMMMNYQVDFFQNKLLYYNINLAWVKMFFEYIETNKLFGKIFNFKVVTVNDN